MEMRSVAFKLRCSHKLLFVLCLLAFIYKAKGQEDTVGFWKIQFNNKEINPVTLNSEQSYIILALNDTDKVSIFYYIENPCKKCLCKVDLRNETGVVWKTIQRKGYGDNIPFVFTGKELEPQLAKGRVYMYFTGKWDGWMSPVFLGALRHN